MSQSNRSTEEPPLSIFEVKKYGKGEVGGFLHSNSSDIKKNFFARQSESLTKMSTNYA